MPQRSDEDGVRSQSGRRASDRGPDSGNPLDIFRQVARGEFRHLVILRRDPDGGCAAGRDKFEIPVMKRRIDIRRLGRRRGDRQQPGGRQES